MSDINQVYLFLKKINDFKKVDRLSLIEKNGRRESDAEHSWHLAMAVWICSNYIDKNIDQLKAIKMAILHDLVEIISNDVYGAAPQSDRVGKKEREQAAASHIFSQLPKLLEKELMDIWQEYEKRESEESKLVWTIDKLMPRLQLAITGSDAAKDLPTDTKKMREQEQKISNYSTISKTLLELIHRDKLHLGGKK